MAVERRRAAGVSVALLLDEMHPAAVAEALRLRGHDVISVAADPDLRGMIDLDLFAWCGQESRRLVTEDVKDFRRLLLRAEESSQTVAPLLFTSGRTFPRSRRNHGRLIAALDAWLQAPDVDRRPIEDWLQSAAPSPR